MTYSPSFFEADSYQAAVGVKCGSLNFGALQQYVEILFDPIFFLFPVIVKVNLNIFGDTPANERPCTSPDSVCDWRTTQWMMQDKQ